jgi:hypothetical protein
MGTIRNDVETFTPASATGRRLACAIRPPMFNRLLLTADC